MIKVAGQVLSLLKVLRGGGAGVMGTEQWAFGFALGSGIASQ